MEAAALDARPPAMAGEREREGEGFARRAHRKLSGKAAIKLANTGANAIPPQVQRSSTEYLANTEYVAVCHP